MRLIIFTIFITYAALSAQAQPVMVKNIRPGSSSIAFFLTEKYAVAGNTFYFEANDGTNGPELWKSDGTAAGTVLVRDIYPGTVQSGIFGDVLVEFQGHLYFLANYPGEEEIWRTVDGPEGAVPLTDDCPGPCLGIGGFYFEPKTLAVFHDKLYLQYASLSAGEELWVTDGTAAGTMLVKDIAPGSFASRPENLTVFKDKIYFLAIESFQKGQELWVSDGTEAGTQLLKDINPGPFGSSDSYIDVIVAGADAFYFWADDGANGKELWRSDGTAAGTALLKDVVPGAGSGAPSYPLNEYLWLGNQLLFIANDGSHGEELWITDGTESGTRLVRDINPGLPKSEIIFYGVLQGKAIFRANDGTSGRELWITDGTEAGTTLLKDILPGSGGSLEMSLDAAVFQNYLFFTADDGVDGRELWITDGTAAGTVLHTTIRPGSIGSEPSGFSLIGNTMFFFAGTSSAGRELWKYDLTPLSAAAPEPLSAAVFPTVSADGRFAIQAADTGEGLRVEAFDLPGRLHTVRILSPGTQELDLSILRSGAYILRLTGTDSGRSTVVRVFVSR